MFDGGLLYRGNITNTSGVTYVYDEVGKLVSVTENGVTTNITYDVSGNPLNYHNGMSFQWEMGRQLAGITNGNTTISYTYNEDGIRTRKTVNGVTAEYYYVKNLQGDIIDILDNNGNVVVSYEYDAWGKILSVSGSLASTVGQANPFRYRGYYYDNESEFYYLQSRYYDTGVRRFINADEIMFLGASGTVLGYNLYAYCENNPVNYLDECGEFSIKVYVVAAITAAVMSAIAKIVGNYANGYRGSKLFRGVLGASVGSAVNTVLLLKLIRKGNTGILVAAFVASSVQSVFDFAESVLIDKKASWKQLTYDLIFNMAATYVGNYIGGRAIYINGKWIQPTKIKTFFTKGYGKRIIAQTGIGSVLNLLIDLVKSGLKKVK